MVVAACCAAALAVSGCADATETAAPEAQAQTVTVTVTQTETVVADQPTDDYGAAETETPVVDETTTFEGEYFSVDYPDDWEVETAEVSKGSYLDTTIRDAIDSDVMLRVDVSPGSYSDPAEVATEVEAYLTGQPRYRRLRYAPTSFLGYDAFRWDFVVEEDGVLLRKSDIFFTSEAGDGVAVLIQAPARRYLGLAGELEDARQTLTIVGEYDGGEDEYVEPTEGDEAFCATHECIDNFEEGNGYAVQCEDGSWSQSGGIQGACSHHGGVADGGGVPSAGSGYDPNNDGSTTNWCGASRDGDGDGLWCEGR